MAKRADKTQAASPVAPFSASPWRNRITGLILLKDAEEIAIHQNNWRTHDDVQRETLRGLLGQVGIVNAAIGYHSQADGGRMKLIDGHLRREEIRQGLPVLMTDLNDAEAALVLATLDPLGAMAGTDAAQLDVLLHQVSTGNAAVQQMLSQLAERNHLIPASELNLDEFFQNQPDTQPDKEKLVLQYPAPQMVAVKNALAAYNPIPEQALLKILDL
jgi:hypothetical protein